MSFLDNLAGELLGPKSTKELAQSTGASAEQVQQVVTAALPLLVSGMFQNAGTEEGAKSLEKALDKHAPKAQKSTSAMLKAADAEDGRKIVAHVLGDQEKDITKGLSKASGLSGKQTAQILSMLAPVVLSLMGNFKQEEQAPAQAQSSSSGLTGLLGSALLGSSFQQVQPAQQSGLNLTNIAGALLGGSSQSASGVQPITSTQSASSQGGGLGSLLGGLLGGSSQAQAPAAQSEQSGGLNLSGLLMGLLK